jgi:hypothetical protein
MLVSQAAAGIAAVAVYQAGGSMDGMQRPSAQLKILRTLLLRGDGELLLGMAGELVDDPLEIGRSSKPI